MNPAAVLSEWQARGRFIKLPGVASLSETASGESALKVFVIDVGSPHASAADTALLIHGFPESSYSWHKVINGLAERFERVVAIDLPGFGLSDKPLVGYGYSLIEQADTCLQVWRELGINGGHAISHDMGTSVLTELVARHSLGTLPACFNAGLQSLTFTNGSMVLALAKLRVMQRVLLTPFAPMLSRFASYGLFEKTVLSAHGVVSDALMPQHALSDADVQMLWENCTQQRGHKMNHLLIRYLNDRKRFEQSRWLPALKASDQTLPIHFCWGDVDQVARIAMARYLSEQVCPNSTLTEMPGVGHFCQWGSPELWLTSVLSFFKRYE